MKIKRQKSKRSIRRGERHGYNTENKVAKEIKLNNIIREELKEL